MSRRFFAILCLASAFSGEIGFVYVEANVGTASGGHAAVRLGETAFHFQAALDGLLILAREDWKAFQYRYGTLENRPIHVASIAVGSREFRRLRDNLGAAFLSQCADFDTLAKTRDGIELLEALAGERSTVRVRGAGLLDPDRPSTPVAVQLRERIGARYGDDFLTRESARLEAALASLSLLDPKEPLSRRGERRAIPERLERFRELLLELEAVRALLDGYDLDQAALLPPIECRALDSGEMVTLTDFGAKLEETILDLLDSSRPDRGRPLLLAIARHLAVARSLEESRLRLLDPLAGEEMAKDADAGSEERKVLSASADAVARSLANAHRRCLGSSLIDEPTYNLLERLGGRLRELRSAADRGRPARELSACSIPDRWRDLPITGIPHDIEEIRGALRMDRERLKRLRLQIQGRYPYRLLDRNCVTEIVRGLSNALGGTEGMRRVLGGSVEPGEGLGFIPSVFFDQVCSRFARVRLERLAPYRERALARLREEGNPLLVYAREANTLTASVYEPRRRDGVFLFFTDDVFWPRPLFGVLNVGYALAHSVTGVITAPFDGGRRFTGALEGAFFSLPELAFWNIRKGSFDAASLPP